MGTFLRAAVMVLLVGILVAAQFLRADNWFPLGSIGQYAYPRDPEGDVINTYVMGTNNTGAEVRVGLTPASAAIAREEFVLHLPKIMEDADVLGDVFEVWQADNLLHWLAS